jgi:hypothetical protein
MNMAITAEQKAFLNKHIENLDKVLESDDINDLLLAIDDAILDTLDSNGNPSAVGIELQKVYDDIYENY